MMWSGPPSRKTTEESAATPWNGCAAIRNQRDPHQSPAGNKPRFTYERANQCPSNRERYDPGDNGPDNLGAPGPSIQDGVRQLLDSEHKNIILDLAGVTFLDSSGLGQLVGSYATALSHGCDIKLINLNKRVWDLMQITKLYTVFSIYTDEETALRSFEAESVPA